MIDPKGMSPIAWTDQMSILLDRYGTVGRLDDPSAWREWAIQANSLSAVAALNPPDPYSSGDFEAWAIRFNQSVDFGA